MMPPCPSSPMPPCRHAALQFPDTDGPIVGLDLSPYMLAVAEWERRRQQQQQAANQPVRAEERGLQG